MVAILITLEFRFDLVMVLSLNETRDTPAKASSMPHFCDHACPHHMYVIPLLRALLAQRIYETHISYHSELLL